MSLDSRISLITLTFLIRCICVVTVVGFALAFPTHNLPSIRFHDLLNSDPSVIADLSHYFVTLGIIEIKDIPQYGILKTKALRSVAECLDNENELHSIRMSDKTYRKTTAAATINRIRGNFNSFCAIDAELFRSIVDNTVGLVFKSLDSATRLVATSKKDDINTNHVMSPYESYSDLYNHGNHLEHIHAYYSSTDDAFYNSGVPKPPTLDFHTDSGLFIAMTTGYFAKGKESKQSGLYIELPTGVIASVKPSNDSLIIMIGDGGASWISPVLGKPLRAVPHALIADLQPGSTRAWYGKMFLPPSDAIVLSHNLPYETFRSRQLVDIIEGGGSKNNDENGNMHQSTYTYSNLPSACGYSRVLASADSNCPNGNVYCWMACMNPKDLGLSCNSTAICVDPTTGVEHDGGDMCTDCTLQCPTITNSSWDGWCYGSGTTMYMNGFTSVATAERGSTACINLMFTTWTLNTKVKYAFGCIGIFFIGVSIQFLTWYRLRLDQTKMISQVKIVVLYGLQMLLSYFIMLAAMTYSTELFCMVIFGLTVGYAVFNLKGRHPTHLEPCCVQDSDLNLSLMEKDYAVNSSFSLK